MLGECTCLDAGTTVDAPSDAFVETADACLASESCNGVDDDCDAVIDEGFVCPDAVVEHTEPFTRAVWVHAMPSVPTRCGVPRGFFQLWPTLLDEVICGFDARFVHLADDGIVHYINPLDGSVRRFSRTGMDPVLPTPPCATSWGHIGFDALGRLYYQCDDTSLRRTGGELLAVNVRAVEAVFPSGRSVILRDADPAPVATLLDVDGFELGGPDFRGWAGRVEPLETSSSVQGESAWMLFARRLPDDSHEVVVMRVDSDTAAWRVVRRVPTTGDFGAPRMGPDPLGRREAT